MTKLLAGVGGGIVAAGITFAIVFAILDRGVEQNATAACITGAMGVWVIAGLIFASLTSKEKQ